MDTTAFLAALKTVFSVQEMTKPTDFRFDPLPNVQGKTAPKVQRLLQLGVRCLPPEECYFEVGTFQGKTLISAALFNEDKHLAACDDFSEFTDNPEQALDVLRRNISRHCPPHQCIDFHMADFRRVLREGRLSKPIGFYFNDGAHDYANQFDGMTHVEDHLADEALVLVDDWRFTPDSRSQARQATLDAIARSKRKWELIYELPARFNGDAAMWWNGLGLLRTWVSSLSA
ncbi:class I SAM-dependent methyltransferase [Desulfonatronum lacustre]|uniref:class I SAM-dependent methyltransferase n=1 Tax=Desulfonatronum lacustre TaxID=66849 RepID=UPI00048F54DE|nr:class I SAM-dependent methyltransferase [Desulfonatronum lacustre]